MLGRAGIGKTTLCQYIAYTWSQKEESERLWADRFKGVIWIRLRELRNMKEGSDIYDVVRQQCLRAVNRRKYTADQVANSLEDSEEVLWILDGYDEIARGVV